MPKKCFFRDLKPENIVFESEKLDSLLKIIDFGTSRKFDPNKKMTKTLGTVKHYHFYLYKCFSLIILLPRY